MPFIVQYHIYQSGKNAPCFTTDEPALAKAKLNDLKRKDGMLSYTTDVSVRAVQPSKSEQYVLLVYNVRKAMKKYFRKRDTQDLQAALALERQLDDWNRQTRRYINNRPGFEDVLKRLPAHTEKALHFAFFQVVEQWRDVFKKYLSYKKMPDKEIYLLREMKKHCLDLERTIDNYIASTIGIH